MSSGGFPVWAAGSGATESSAAPVVPTTPSFDDLAHVRQALDLLRDEETDLRIALERVSRQIARLEALLA